MIDKYKYRYTVTAADMAADYTLTPNAILMYAQDCFARMMTQCHVAAFDVVNDNRMWVISEYTANIGTATAFWSEEVDVELWVSELTPLRVYIDFRIVRADSQLTVATGSFQMNILNSQTHRIAPTDFLQGRFNVIPEMMTPSHKKALFPKAETPLIETEHTVTRLDVDFNGHMGNRSYVDLALLSLPDSTLQNKRLKSMTVHWLHESRLGDVLRCKTCAVPSSDDLFLHTITNADQSTICELLTQWQTASSTPDIAKSLVRKPQ